MLVMRKYILALGLIAMANEHGSYRMNGNRSCIPLCVCVCVCVCVCIYICVYMYMALYIVRKLSGTNMATMRT